MPRRNTTDEIMAKFDKVVTDDTLNIAEADLGYCERMQTLYIAKIQELNKWEEQLLELHEKNPQPPHITTKNNYGNRLEQRVDNDFTKHREAVAKNPFDFAMFSPLYAITWLHNKRRDVESTFVSKIVDYFNGEYNLSTSVKEYYFFNEETGERKEPTTYEPLVKAIIEQCGGLSFKEVGIGRMKDAFREQVAYQERIKVTGNKLTLLDYFYYNHSSWREPQWEYNDSRLWKLAEAMSFFEFKTLGINCNTLLQLSGKEVDFKNPYYLDNFDKIESMKVFKNGRVDIKFHGKGVPQEFFDFFELTKLPERWR